jgi:Leucine-rich repeat (LRR) protein
VALKSNDAKALRKLAARFKSLGISDPEAWARSELQEGIPQLGRAVFLRALWDAVLKYPPESRDTAIEIARDLCYLLEGPPALMPSEFKDINWGLFLRDDEEAKERLPGLVESFDEVRPEGHAWGSPTTVVTLRTATDSDLDRALNGLEHLEALWLGESEVSDTGLRHLRRHPTLQVLDLSGTKITDACAAELKHLPNLNALYMADTAITDRCLAELSTFPKLNTMNFVNTAVTDAGLEHLGKRKTLEFVLLNGTKVTAKGLAKLRKQFPDATVRYDE